MKNAINITEKIKEGATLKKLALGEMTIVGDKIVERTDDMKPVREIRDASTPGFFVRLNSNTLKHTFNGQLQNGSKFKIGDVYSITVKDAKQKLADERGVSKKESRKKSTKKGTLGACVEKWIISRPRSKSAKYDPVTQSTATKKTQTTINHVLYWVERYSSDWLDIPISEIDDDEIEARADEIAAGERLGNVKNADQLKNGDLYNNAHHWLKSCSAVVAATTRMHKSPNFFREIMIDEYPARDGGHRRLSEYEISTILNVTRDNFRFKTTRRPDQPVKGHRRNAGDLDFEAWRKMLLLQFTLLSGFRIGGVRTLKVKEINGMNIHRPSMDKSGRPHTLPITTQLRELLDEIIRIKNGKDDETPKNWPREIVKSEFLFCNNEGNGYGPNSKLFEMARNRLSRLETVELPKLQGTRMREAKLMTAHDLRVTLASEAADADVSEAQGECFLGQSAPKGVHWRYRQEGEARRRQEFDDLTTALQATHDRMFAIKDKPDPSHEMPKEEAA